MFDGGREGFETAADLGGCIGTLGGFYKSLTTLSWAVNSWPRTQEVSGTVKSKDYGASLGRCITESIVDPDLLPLKGVVEIGLQTRQQLLQPTAAAKNVNVVMPKSFELPFLGCQLRHDASDSADAWPYPHVHVHAHGLASEKRGTDPYAAVVQCRLCFVLEAIAHALRPALLFPSNSHARPTRSLSTTVFP